MVQLSHPFVTTDKTIALTLWTFVSKVISLIFNTLSRFVIAFLPGGKHLLISWLYLLSTVNLEHKVIKSIAASTFSSTWCIKNILETGNCRCVVSATHYWVKKDMTPFNRLLIFDGPDSVFSRILQWLSWVSCVHNWWWALNFQRMLSPIKI